jgi:hypothetical protein
MKTIKLSPSQPNSNQANSDNSSQFKADGGSSSQFKADGEVPFVSSYYYSPHTSQSSVIGYSREERERLFPSNLSQINDLNRNIAILSKPEDVVVHLPMSMQLSSINYWDLD